MYDSGLDPGPEKKKKKKHCYKKNIMGTISKM